MKNKIDLRKKVGLELFKKYRDNVTKIHELNYLFWECTLRCNLNCLHCGSDCMKNSSVKDMPAKDFFRVLDEIEGKVNANKTIIVLTGGEPLMRNDLEMCGKEFNRRGYPWGIVTNGLMLDRKRLISLLNAGMNSMTISLDGFETEHNQFRGNKKSFVNAVDAIKAAASYSDLVFDVVTCVNKNNITYLDEFKEFLINIGLKRWRIFTVFPIGRAAENPELLLSNEQFRTVFDFIKRTRQENKINLNYGCEGFLGNYETEVRDNFFFCRAGITIGSVLVDGSISACPSLRENFTQGNIYNDNFWDVWENRFQNMRDRSWTKTGKCADCKYYKYCLGNGLHLRNEKTGELLLCHYEKIVNE